MFFLVNLIAVSLFAQGLITIPPDLKVQNNYVKYIGQFPSKVTTKPKGFIEKIGNLILGAEPVLLNKPVNIIASDPQTFWLLNQGNGTLIKNNQGNIIIPSSLKKKKHNFPSLVGITFLDREGILFTDSRQNKIYQLSADEKEIKIFNDSLALNQPTGIAYSKVSGEIWVVETGSHCISVLNSNGTFLRRIGKRGKGEGEFNFPTDVWIDRSGNGYIVDALNFRIQIFDSEGKFLSSFGTPGNATGFFARPKGVATDSQGNIYVTDALFNVVQIFDKSGKFLYYFGSQGQGEEQFWMPSGIYVDGKDFIYIADSYNTRIQIYQLMKGGE